MTRYYLDTSIWLDYYEKREKNGEVALKLINKIIKENCIIGYSDLGVGELKNIGYTKREINEILRVVKPQNSRRLHSSRAQLEEVNKITKIRNIPRKDVLHAILCRDNDFQLIATDKHFEQLKNITHAKRPVDII